MHILKHEAFYFISFVFYLFIFIGFGCLQPRCASAALLDHFGAHLLLLFSYVWGILIMKQSLISFYHRHDACIPATTKDPSGTISHLFLSRIPACICPHSPSQVTGITFERSVHCSIFHLAPHGTRTKEPPAHPKNPHSFSHVVTLKRRGLLLMGYQAATSGSPGSLN